MDAILGLAMIYATIHFFILQRKIWNELTTWEKVVTGFAMFTIMLTYFSLMFE